MPGSVGLAIAGVWYLLLGLAGPLVAARRAARGEDPRWRLAWRSFVIAAAMLAALAGTLAVVTVVASSGIAPTDLWPALLRSTAILLGILASALLVVQVTAARTRRADTRS
jgi:hypothetical protein